MVGQSERRYTVTIEGEGGEFSFLTLSPACFAYWKQRGNAALQRYLMAEDDGGLAVPMECVLGRYYDTDQAGYGIDLDTDYRIAVEDESGAVCFQSEDAISDELIDFRRNINDLQLGVYYRTFEKMSMTYAIVTDEAFNSSDLKIIGIGTPRAELVNACEYKGQDLVQLDSAEKSWAIDEVEFVDHRQDAMSLPRGETLS